LSTMKREEFRTVYDSGFEATFALVQSLWHNIDALSARVQQLEDRLAKNSRNSSKPPSSDDPVKPKPKSLRRRSGKKPGGQEGHPGRTLSLIEDPPHVVDHDPEECEGCGESLSEAEFASGYERRQVVDIPALLALEVTEHRARHKRCPGCGRSTKAAFPLEASTQEGAVGYGPRIKALAVYLMEYQLLPYERASELLSDLFGEPTPGAGTLHSALKRCFEGLEETEEAIKEGLVGGEEVVGGFDETGMRVAGEGMWVHVASTGELTHYAMHEKRGVEATKEIGILPSFRGVAVHDGLSAYWKYECCSHALCNAHHLRELTFVEEEHEQEWAGRMKALLLEVEETVREDAAWGGTRLEPERVEKFEMRYQELLEAGLAANPPPIKTGKRGRPKQTKGKNLVDRLDKHREAVLRFMYDFRVPFDNNRAERDLRMVKVRQKISGGFRTRRGAQMFCRIRGYISTVRKQGENVLAALEHVFMGDPFVPSLQAE
jgi:transposase